MVTVIIFVVASFFTNFTANGNSGYVPGLGEFQGMIPGWAATIAIFAISFGLIVDISRSWRLSKYQTPLIAALIWRVFLVFFDRYGQSIYQLPNSGFDSSVFYRNAAIYSATGEAGRGGTFSTFMGWIFRFTGVSQLYGQFIICLFSMVAIIALCYIFEEISEDLRLNLLTVALVGFLPNYAILSSIFLRESIVSMCVALSVYMFVLWMKSGDEIKFVFAFIFVLFGALFHSGTISVAIAYIGIRMLYDKQEQRFHISIRNLPITGVLIVAVIYLYLNYGALLFSKMTNLSSLSDIGSTYSEGGSSYAAYVGNSASVRNMVVYTIPRMLYFLFSPFPWQWRGLSDIIAFVFSSLFYLISLITAIKHISQMEDSEKRYRFAFLIIAFCSAFVFSWGTTNTGTATRHREKMVIVYAVLYLLGNGRTQIASNDESKYVRNSIKE